MNRDETTGDGSVRSRLLKWRSEHVPDTPFMFITVTVVGLATGACAFVLKRMVAWISHGVMDYLTASGPDWQFIVAPVVGILLTSFVTAYIMRAKLSHGVRRLKKALKLGDYKVSPDGIIYPMIASSITLGFGGSSGSEGPIACTGAAIGGNAWRWTGMSPQLLTIMVGCGAGAGIAGIFKAPLGGALFTLEVMRIPMSTVPVLALVVCALVSAMTAYALGGFTLDVTVQSLPDAFDPSLIGAVILLGVVCGLYSLYYSYIVKITERFLDGISSRWVKNVIAGASIGLVIFIFPSLYGEGYGVIGHLLNGDYGSLLTYSWFEHLPHTPWLLVAVAFGIVIVKCFATSATNSGGGVAGDFAPTLFAGCVLGFGYAMLADTLFGVSLPVGIMALAGMAGVMSGVIRAPLMAMILTSEMVGGYSCFLLLMTAAAVSFGIVRLVTFDDYYRHSADRINGLAFRHLNRR